MSGSKPCGIEKRACRKAQVTALDIVDPVAAPRLLAEDVLDRGRPLLPARHDATVVSFREYQLDGRLLRNRRRQHEAAVVVGVLADQVDAPRRRRSKLVLAQAGSTCARRARGLRAAVAGSGATGCGSTLGGAAASGVPLEAAPRGARVRLAATTASGGSGTSRAGWSGALPLVVGWATTLLRRGARALTTSAGGATAGSSAGVAGAATSGSTAGLAAAARLRGARTGAVGNGVSATGVAALAAAGWARRRGRVAGAGSGSGPGTASTGSGPGAAISGLGTASAAGRARRRPGDLGLTTPSTTSTTGGPTSTIGASTVAGGSGLAAARRRLRTGALVVSSGNGQGAGMPPAAAFRRPTAFRWPAAFLGGCGAQGAPRSSATRRDLSALAEREI